jgi:hypothetical protein
MIGIMRNLVFILAFMLLSSCSGNSFVIVSTPPGAKISIEGIDGEKNSPADFGKLQEGSYKVTANLPGYLPTSSNIFFDPKVKSSYTVVMMTEPKQDDVFKPGLPDKGVRVRSVPDAKTSSIIAFNVLNGSVGKWIELGETPILADWSKLLDLSGVKNDFGTCAIVECKVGKSVGYSFLAEAKDSYFQILEPPNVVKVNKKITLQNISSKTLQPTVVEKSDSLYDVKLGAFGNYSGTVKFSGVEAFGKSIWSYIDEQGFQDVVVSEGGKNKTIWHGEYGLGALGHLPINATICSILDDKLVAVALTTAKGYALGIIDTNTGKVVSETPLRKIPQMLITKKVGSTYAVYLQFAKDPITCLSFDPQGKQLTVPTAINAEFTWLPCPVVNAEGKTYIYVNGMYVGFGSKDSKNLALLMR